MGIYPHVNLIKKPLGYIHKNLIVLPRFALTSNKNNIPNIISMDANNNASK